MGTQYLIDTNVILEYLSGSLPSDAHLFVESALNNDFNVSVINRIEILGHESATKELTEFMDLAITHSITQEIEEQTINIRKQKKIKLPDAIIAATAIALNLTLVSRNIKDFQNIQNLHCVNPYQL